MPPIWTTTGDRCRKPPKKKKFARLKEKRGYGGNGLDGLGNIWMGFKRGERNIKKFLRSQASIAIGDKARNRTNGVRTIHDLGSALAGSAFRHVSMSLDHVTGSALVATTTSKFSSETE